MFKDLYDYTHHCNMQIIDIVLQNGALVPDDALKLLHHTLNAQHIWNARILGAPAAYGVWERHPTENLEEIATKNLQTTMHILENIALDKEISYSNSAGMAFTNNVSDILFHVVNHSTYHRGQIISLIKRAGIPPISTDYIFYKR